MKIAIEGGDLRAAITKDAVTDLGLEAGSTVRSADQVDRCLARDQVRRRRRCTGRRRHIPLACAAGLGQCHAEGGDGGRVDDGPADGAVAGGRHKWRAAEACAVPCSLAGQDRKKISGRCHENGFAEPLQMCTAAALVLRAERSPALRRISVEIAGALLSVIVVLAPSLKGWVDSVSYRNRAEGRAALIRARRGQGADGRGGEPFDERRKNRG